MASEQSEIMKVVLRVALEELADSSEIDDSDPVYEHLVKNTSTMGPELLGTGRIRNYVEETVPTYSDPLFRAHFRMNRTSFQALLELVGPLTTVRSVSLQKRTLACLWYLSNQETFRGVADRFGLSKGSLHYFLECFCKTMCGKQILPSLISWPDTSSYHRIAEGFAQRAGFPGVIGAVDGTYIPITGPSEYRDSYICRKGFPAFHLQAVCDSSLKFLDVYSAYPGSVHDSRVFKNSPLYQHLEKEDLRQYHLLGDSAYGMTQFLIVPFRDNGHLSSEQKKFNFAHSSTRVDIERSFGLLKGKMRKLKFLDMNKVSLIPNIVVSCCALHNFILMKESFVDDEIEVLEEEPSLPKSNISEDINQLGTLKRNEIMALLA